jgi:SAM-dependent methyltransferase
MSDNQSYKSLDSLRDRWLRTDSFSYDQVTATMKSYLAAIDKPLLSICRGNVLELACGTGRMLNLIYSLPNIDVVVGLDIANQMLRAAAAKGCGNLIEGYAESLPFTTASFDTVICAFYSFRDIDRPPAYREIARILRRGGCFGFTLRNYYLSYLESLWRHFLRRGRWPHCWRKLDDVDGVTLDLKDINQEVDEIERAGLVVREIKTVRFLPFLRRFWPTGYWSGARAAKFGSDIIFIIEKN